MLEGIVLLIIIIGITEFLIRRKIERDKKRESERTTENNTN